MWANFVTLWQRKEIPMNTTNSLQASPVTDAPLVSSDKDELQNEIDALAAMPLLKYERVYKDAAKRLGMRASVLDKAVKAARSGERKDAAAMFQDEEPWDSTVDAATIIRELAEAFRRYAVLPPHADMALALWCIFTWFFNESHISPLLVIRSPEKGCGKSTVMEILKRLVYRPLISSGMTSPVLFRVIDKQKPTVLIDEGDTFLNNENLELHGVINCGYSKTASFVWRCTGDDHEPTPFNVFCPKAIAFIGHTRDTLHDRAVEIELRRKLPHEKIARLRHGDGAELDVLRRKLARLSADRVDDFSDMLPVMPDVLPDRQADNWEPLVKAAMLGGEECELLAKQAAVALTSSKTENAPMSVGVELMADIQQVFQSRNTTRIRSVDLIKWLCEGEDAAWETYNRGKPITPKQLSKRLSEFGIKSRSVRIAHYGVQKCFDLEWFADAFARYLTAPDVDVTQLQPNPGMASDVTDAGGVTVTHAAPVTPEPSNGGDCNRVTD
jgi:putative DNA primase/helicase